MSASETIFLVMSDPARRAVCFAALADQSQRIVRGFANAGDAIEAMDGSITGCLVIDRGGLAPAMLSELLRSASGFPALVPLLLADHLDPREILAVVRAAPLELLPAETTPEVLAHHVALLLPVAAARGQRWRDSRAAAAALATLSPRETDVLAALVRGQTSKDIARAMGVSPRTVEVHRASIMRRTGSSSLAALLRLSIMAELSDGEKASKAA